MSELFVGRVDEQAVAAQLVTRARSGRPMPLLVRGDPGIGKSTLLERLVAEADRTGFRTIVVGAYRIDAGVPYAALRLALEPMLSEECHPSLAAQAEVLLGALSRRPDRPSGRDEIPVLLQRLLEGWAFRSPVLLALDDLHHADEHTVATVLHLVRHVRRHRLLIVATTRPAPFSNETLSAALDALAEAELIHVVELGAFDHAELAELVRRRTAHEPTERLVRLLHDRTGGLPFFVVELLDAMERSGELSVQGGRLDASDSAERALPSRVSTAVLHRLFGLGPDARLVTSAAAILGRVPGSGMPLLAAVSGLDLPRVTAAFETLVSARVLVAAGQDHLFSHGIVRDAVYEDIGPAARRRLHGRAARALADGGPWGGTDILEIARHVLASSGRRDAVAAEILAQAGSSIADVAPQAASDWYRASLARLDPTDERVVPIQLDLSRALDLAGAHAEAARLSAAALDAATGRALRLRAVQRTARALGSSGQWQAAADLLDGAMADPAVRTPAALLHLAEILLWSERRSEVAALVAEARTHRIGRYQAVADALDMYDAIATGRFTDAKRLEQALGAQVDALTASGRISVQLSCCIANAVNFDPEAAVALADAIDDDAPLAKWFRSLAAWARYRQGRFDEVEQRSERARDDAFTADGRPSSGPWLASLIASRVERADPAAAEIAGLAERARTIRGFQTQVDVGLALWHRTNGDHDVAEALLADAAERERSRGQVNLLAMALSAGVDAAIERGDDVAAASRNQSLQALANEGSVAITMQCLLANAIATADIGAAHQARDHGVRYGLAADAGRALGLIGSLAGDADLLAAAYRELGDLGAMLRQRTVAHELRRLGRRVPQGPPGPADLTAVEVEVIGLVTGGLTNRQVADRMGLSPKTVEVYLSRIYTKTGRRSRVELAVAAREGSLA